MFGRADHPAMNVNQTVLVAEDWRGKVGMAGYLAAVVLAFVLYPPQGSARKPYAGQVWARVCWSPCWPSGAGCGSQFRHRQHAGRGWRSGFARLGGLLNVVAGLVVAVGELVKAREEKLFGGEHVRLNTRFE